MFLWMLVAFLCVDGNAAELQLFEQVTLIENAGNDGDSFLVRLDKNRDVRVRLYFVDCPETGGSWESDFRRIREQRRFFGLPQENLVTEYGRRATAFTREALKEPFTVFTSFASALGRSTHGRVYGFVTTADGNDLASELVRAGLARVYGVGRALPSGESRDELKASLSDMQAVAMLKNTGIWEQTDPDELEKARAQQRKEEKEIKSIRADIRSDDSPHVVERININECTRRELQRIPGIGPATAGRIITNRPYSSVNDLINIRGISKTKLSSWEPYMKAAQ